MVNMEVLCYTLGVTPDVTLQVSGVRGGERTTAITLLLFVSVGQSILFCRVKKQNDRKENQEKKRYKGRW